MKTATNKLNKKYIRIQQSSTIQELSKKEPVADETDMEIHMIPIAPSFLGVPMWKFFVVKDKK